MKKIIGIIFINIIIFIFFTTIINVIIERLANNYTLDEKLSWFSNNITKNFNELTLEDIENFPIEERIVKSLKLDEESFEAFCGEERKKYETSGNNPSIVTLGCSYSYGHGLKKEETFQTNLQKIKNYNIYNYSKCGGEILESIKDLNQEIDIIPDRNNVEYVVYVYMHDHIGRLLSIRTIYKHYEFLFDNSTNKFIKKLIRFPLLKLVFSSYKFYEIKKGLPSIQNIEQFYKLVIRKSYNRIKELFPNSKIIIILYNEKLAEDFGVFHIWYVSQIIESKIWQELEKETNGNIQIVRTRDIMGFYFDKNYKLEEDIADWHPNARVWKEFTPKFASKYIK